MRIGEEAGRDSQDIGIYARHFDIGPELGIWPRGELSEICVTMRERRISVQDIRSYIQVLSDGEIILILVKHASEVQC